MFISFEGIDGCGKSTQLELFRKRLNQEGYRTLKTREPGGTRLSESIREIILKSKAHISPRAELLLYLAARAQNVSEIIAPALAKRIIVLTDRFSDSTLAYQGGGRGLSTAEILRVNASACAGLEPDITFLFDLPAQKAFLRISSSGRPKDRMEREGLRFMEKVRRAYLKLAKAFPKRFVLINADGDINSVASAVWQAWTEKSQRPAGRSERKKAA